MVSEGDEGKGDEIKNSIIKGEYVIPDFVSSNLRNLIEGMLQYNGNKRMHIKEVLKHKWFSKYF